MTLILILGFYVRVNLDSCDNYSSLWEYVFAAKQMLLGENNISMYHPKGFSLILAFTSIFFGFTYKTIITMGLLFSVLTTFLVFLITYVISKDEYVSLLSSLILSIFHSSVRLSYYGGVEVAGTFFLTLSILFFLISLKERTKKMFTLTFIALIFSIFKILQASINLGDLSSTV